MSKKMMMSRIEEVMTFFSLLGGMLQTSPSEERMYWFQTLSAGGKLDQSAFGEEQPDIIEGRRLIHAWFDDVKATEVSEQVEMLSSDFNSLFSDPDKPLASPWESSYFSDVGQQAERQREGVRNWFHRFIEEPDKIENSRDDHIGLELSFVGYLSSLALAAAKADAHDEFDDIFRSQREFILQHPAKWAASWADRVLEYAQTDFYRGLALLVRGGLRELTAAPAKAA